MLKRILVPAALCLFLASCALRMFPPAFDLGPLQRIGLAEFSVEKAEGPLGRMATQQFLEEILRWQRVEVVDLGPLEEALGSVGADRPDRLAYQALGDRYDVAAVFTGRILISDIRPEIDLRNILRRLSVRARFNIFISATLVSTDSGGVMWTRSTEREGEAARLGVGPRGVFDFGLRDQEENHRRMLQRMVRDITRDFRRR
ncbi:MAG: hypothetical protein JW747_04400 [Candidatus Aminicenantes bacterium]|nr:hypothetical protein [Candidatus Aminicenantes bacterium]